MRRGIVLPAAIFIMVLIVGYFLSTSFFARQHSGTAHRYFEGTTAVSLAEAALDDIQRVLARPGLPKDRPKLAEFYAGILAKPDSELGGKVFQAETGPEIQRLVEDHKAQPILHGNVGVEVTLEVAGLRPLPIPAAAVGFQPDPREREGMIRISARAWCGPVTRVLSLLRRIKVVSVVHPVLSRFTLFVRNPPEDQGLQNPLHQKVQEMSRERDRFSLADGRPAKPIVLDHGISFDLVAGQRWDFSKVRAGIADAVGGNGLVFLGNGAWEANLSEGMEGDDLSERFLLRTRKYRLKTPLDLYLLAWNAMSGSGQGFESPPAIQEFFLECTGFNDDIEFANQSVVRFNDTQAMRFLFRERGWQETHGTFFLRLAGTKNAFSPAFVLGDVKRSYVHLATMNCQLFGRNYENVTLPYLGRTLWGRIARRDPFTDEDLKTRRTLEGIRNVLRIGASNEEGLWEHFAGALMSRIEEEPMNRFLDFSGTNGEDGSPDSPSGAVTNDPVPPDGIVWRSPQLSDALSAGGVRLPRFEPGGQAHLGHDVGIGKPGERPLFQGDLHRLPGFPEIQAKSVVSIDSLESLLTRYQDPLSGEVSVPGIIAIEGQGPMIIEKPLKIGRGHGGIILTRRDIVIRAPVIAGQEPLTLCSGGSITIGTDQPIQASLICLGNGGVLSKEPGLGGFTVKGPVAAGRLDIANLVAGNQRKEIALGPAFGRLRAPEGDPSEPFFPYRFFCSDERRMYFRPGS